MRAILRLIIYMRPYAALAIGATVSLLLVTVSNLVSPLLLRWVIDDGVRASNVSILMWGTAALAIAAIARGIFNFLQNFWGEQASQGVAFDIRNELFAKIQTLSFSWQCGRTHLAQLAADVGDHCRHTTHWRHHVYLCQKHSSHVW